MALAPGEGQPCLGRGYRPHGTLLAAGIWVSPAGLGPGSHVPRKGAPISLPGTEHFSVPHWAWKADHTGQPLWGPVLVPAVQPRTPRPGQGKVSLQGKGVGLGRWDFPLHPVGTVTRWFRGAGRGQHPPSWPTWGTGCLAAHWDVVGHLT